MGAFWNNLLQQLGTAAVLTIIAGVVGFFCWVLACRGQHADLKDLVRTEIASVKGEFGKEISALQAQNTKLEQKVQYLEPIAAKIDQLKDELAVLKKDFAVMQTRYEKDEDVSEILNKIGKRLASVKP